MEQTIQELKLLQKNSEKEISKLETSIVNMKDMETEMEDLKRELTLVTEDSRNNNKILGSTEHDLNKIRMFVKEIYMNLTVTNTLTDTHNSSIQHMYNFTGTINETLVNVQKQLNENIISVTKHLEQMESCQSGGNVELGSLNYPTREFPFELTIPFNPPFRKVPSLLYSNTLLDPVATSYGNSLDIHVKLVSLTPESFTIKLIKPGKTHAIYGARINWIACPKL